MKSRRISFFIVLLGCLTLLIGAEVFAASPSLDKKKVTLYAGFEQVISVKNAGGSRPVWKTSDRSVVKVKALPDGSARLAAGSKTGTAAVTCALGGTVLKCKVKVLGWTMTLSGGSSIPVGGTTSFTFSNRIKAGSFSSSDRKVASVTKKGKVTGKKKGTCFISYKVGSRTYRQKITVGDVHLSASSVTVRVGEAVTLSVEGGAPAVFTCTDPSLVTISRRTASSVFITGKARGSAVIRAKVGKTTISCPLTVLPPKKKMRISTYLYRNGEKDRNLISSTASPGEDGSLTIKNSSSGIYHEFCFFVDGTPVKEGLTFRSSRSRVLSFSEMLEGWGRFYSLEDGSTLLDVGYGGDVYRFHITIADEESASFLKRRNEIIEAAGVRQGMKEQYMCFLLASWMCDNIDYDQSGMDLEMPVRQAGINSSYKDFFHGRALLCGGYSDLYMFLLDALQIPCIQADSLPMQHRWNQVKIDGSWYNVDITWMDPGGTGVYAFQYFLVSDLCMLHYPLGGVKHLESPGHPCTDTRFDGCCDEQLARANAYMAAHYTEMSDPVIFSKYSPWITGSWENY